MRLYRIDIVVELNDHMLLEPLIVPENALGNYQFQASEYIGDLDDAFEIMPVKTDDTPKDDNVVKLKKD